jgi:hypothetical protein
MMDDLNPLGAIGLGLSAAGGALNQNVYNQNADFYSQQQAQRAQKQKFIADLLTDHFQKGTLNAQAYQQAMAKNGTPVPPMQQPMDYASEAADVMEKFDRQEQRPSAGLGPSDALRTPATPALDIKTEGVDQPKPLGVNDVPMGDTKEVSGIRTTVYGPEEMNARIHAYADVLKKSGGSAKEKRQAMNDFVNKMKLENSTQLKEAALLQQIHHQQAMEGKQNRPAILQELDELGKLDPKSPAFKILRDRVVGSTAIMKTIEALADAKHLKPGTEERNDFINAELSQWIKKKTGTTETVEPLTPKGLKVAEEFIRANKPLPGGWSKTGQSRGNAILNKMGEDEEGGAGSGSIVSGQATFHADQASLTKLTAQYDNVTAFEKNAGRQGKVLMALGDKVDSTGTPVIERWIRGGMKAIGTPDVDEFNAQMQIYRTEAARILTNPNLVGVLSDTARKEVEEFMSGKMSAASIRRVVSRLNNDFDARKVTLEQQMDAVTKRLSGKRRATDKMPEMFPPEKNAKGWVLHEDAKGNRAYVGPNGEVEEIK